MMESLKPCPCHSGKPYSDCCQGFHQGSPPETAEQLMRSRYAAYSLGLADYIIQTTHPKNPGYLTDISKWRQDILQFSKMTDFLSLKITDSSQEKEKATVTFIAGLKQSGQDASFAERSRFARKDGRWLYLDGKPEPIPG